MVNEGVLTRTERANRGIYPLAAGDFHETTIPAAEIDTGRITAQIHESLGRVSCIVITVGDPTETPDLLHHYLAGYERVLNESPQVRRRTRIISGNLDVDVMGTVPSMASNNQALDVMGSGLPEHLVPSRYMQQLPTRNEGIVGPSNVFETPSSASPMQSVAGDFAKAPARHPVNWLPSFNAPHIGVLVDTASVPENQSMGLNFLSGTGRGITDISGVGLITDWSEKYPGLASALSDLRESLKSAKEEGGIIAPRHIVAQARTMIRELHSKAPRIYSVYLMPDGTIAIDTRGRKPDGALLTINTDGTVCYSGEKDGQRWHRDYVGRDPLSDQDLVRELCELGLPKK